MRDRDVTPLGQVAADAMLGRVKATTRRDLPEIGMKENKRFGDGCLSFAALSQRDKGKRDVLMKIESLLQWRGSVIVQRGQALLVGREVNKIRTET